ncbi:MAG TPA: hypothetical protein VHG89_05945 [Verrucomicrobiae bacterium]|nr:hypothetical protein [Verrucomicrobiae bacterium]
MKKRRLDQALNIKEFTVLAGISYSVARAWFQIKGFPRVQGVVFWQDFVWWRNLQNKGKYFSEKPSQLIAAENFAEFKRPDTSGLPPRAARILLEMVK